ncbi:MAG: hypothetical protein KTR14_10650 [Vampirovibrio sp.]|nr:hypothetical protein [Vampirovibrio sp.]
MKTTLHGSGAGSPNQPGFQFLQSVLHHHPHLAINSPGLQAKLNYHKPDYSFEITRQNNGDEFTIQAKLDEEGGVKDVQIQSGMWTVAPAHHRQAELVEKEVIQPVARHLNVEA